MKKLSSQYMEIYRQGFVNNILLGHSSISLGLFNREKEPSDSPDFLPKTKPFNA